MNTQIQPESGLNFKLDLREGSAIYSPAPNRQARVLPVSINAYGCFDAGPEHFTDRNQLRCLYQVFWTHSGAGRFLVDGREFIARENTVALLDCSRPHRYETMGDGWNHDWVNFTGSACAAYYDLINPEGFRVLSLDENREIARWMHEIRGSVTRQDMSSFVHTSTCLICLLDAIYALATEQNRQRVGDKRDNVLQSARYIDAHYMEHLTLDELAQSAYLSKFYYSRAFKHYVGMTPMEYLNTVRVSHAKSLLITTELPVEDVGWRTGFGGSKNLIRQFKLATGMTPGEYRRQCFGWDNAHAGAERRS